MPFVSQGGAREVPGLQLAALPLPRFSGSVVWLGTLPGEETAARAYNAAEHATNAVLAFQGRHSTSEILDKPCTHTPTGNEPWRQSMYWHGGRVPPASSCARREHLFQKALTPSDVGKLNRLVVPKLYAEKHFLLKHAPMMVAAMGGCVLLEFEDGEGKVWRFRYSYCTSSRIYILTRGWRHFVREKDLQAGDTVAFSRSASGPFKQLHIDYWKTTQKKQVVDTTADVVSVDSRVVKLFGVDIARVSKVPKASY